jgi:hypothetical protein
MDLNSFFDSLEEIGKRLFHKGDAFENLREVIDLILN